MNISDRDRLTFAFEDLTRLKIRAEISLAREACCYLRGLELLAPHLDGAEGFVFWTIPRDIQAFGDSSPYVCEHMRLPSSHALDTRPHEHERGSTLRRALSLYWRGPVDAMVGTLREWGLHTDSPNGSMTSIEVQPAFAPVRELRVPRARVGLERRSRVS